MCVTNIYTDIYPDGKEEKFRQVSLCPYSNGGRPCTKHSTLDNPVRKIQFGEPSTEYMMTVGRQAFPQTPPHSRSRSGHRHSGHSHHSRSSSDGHRHHSRHRHEEPRKVHHRRHSKAERIVIVDAPPTPRTPPQAFRQTFTAPSSPANPSYLLSGMAPSQKPIIVDERTLRRAHTPPVSIASRRRTKSPTPRFGWDSARTSHTSHASYDSNASTSQARRDAEELARLEARESLRREEDRLDAARRARERDLRIAELEAERRREERIRQQDEEIRRRPAIPLRPKSYLAPPVVVIEQPSRSLTHMMGGLTMTSAVGGEGERALQAEKEARWRAEERDRKLREKIEGEKREDEVLMRLRERQMPSRRFSVGPGDRRRRVMYSDGVYRWE